MKEVKDGKLISYVCVIESAKYKEISVETKRFYPKSICEITEYMIVNKSVRRVLLRKPTSERLSRALWRSVRNTSRK